MREKKSRENFKFNFSKLKQQLQQMVKKIKKKKKEACSRAYF